VSLNIASPFLTLPVCPYHQHHHPAPDPNHQTSSTIDITLLSDRRHTSETSYIHTYYNINPSVASPTSIISLTISYPR
jgi:hypothetical protein